MSPESEIEKRHDNTFSGQVAIITSDGPIVIEIHNATVHEGRPILERNRISSRPVEEDVIRTYQRLGTALDTLAETKPNRESAHENWIRRRRSAIDDKGEKSICNLLPKDLHRDPMLLTRMVNTLCRRGIHTIEDLARLSPTQLRNTRNIGEKMMILITAMRDVAILEIKRKE